MIRTPESSLASPFILPLGVLLSPAPSRPSGESSCEFAVGLSSACSSSSPPPPPPASSVSWSVSPGNGGPSPSLGTVESLSLTSSSPCSLSPGGEATSPSSSSFPAGWTCFAPSTASASEAGTATATTCTLAFASGVPAFLSACVSFSASGCILVCVSGCLSGEVMLGGFSTFC